MSLITALHTSLVSSRAADASTRRRRWLCAAAVGLLLTSGATAAGASSQSSTPADARSGATSAGWELVGTEDFSRLDRDRWHVYDGRRGRGASERARPWRASARGGALRLTSGRDRNGRWSSATVGGWGWQAANRSSGRVDMRVRTDRGPAMSTNLMMWPDAGAGLPALDLYSSPSRWSARQRLQQRTHYTTGTGPGAGTVRQRSSTRRSDLTRWRTVSVRWDESAVTYLVDGRITRIDSNRALIPDASLWPLLQTTLHRDSRGRMPRGKRGPTTSVDWIKVYARDAGELPEPERPTVPTPETPTPETPTPETPTPETPTPETPDPDTTPDTTPTPPQNDGGWTRVGRDDFNGTELDTSRWTTFSGVPGCCKETVWSGSQVEVDNGELVLHNRPTADGWRSGGVGGWKWKDTVQKYGRIDARMRFDKGRGFSAAALTWPADNTWPPELDFYEIFETRGERDMMAQSTHYKQPSAASGRGVDQKFNQRGDFSRWHTISVRWSPTELTYWIDGTRTHTVTDRAKIPDTEMWIGFQTHTHKMDGRWPTLPQGQDTVAFRVDWVEVFSR